MVFLKGKMIMMKRFKTMGIITNYYFDYDMECYIYALAVLMNGHFVNYKCCTHDDEDADIFSKEILDKFNERTQDTTEACEHLVIKIKANSATDDGIELKSLTLENGPKVAMNC